MPRTRRFSDYDPFAWLYHEYWGREFHAEILPVLDKLLLKRLPPKSDILDLCCGDGRLANRLVRNGYRVTGLDGSEGMLAFARQKTAQAEFLLADARSFRLPERFDAVISTFDSLNHVMTTEELRAVFANVFAALHADGYFVFDLNREESYKEIWVRTFVTVDRKAVSIARGAYNRPKRLATCDITLFRMRGGWERSDFRLAQRCHSRNEVTKALREAGFSFDVHDAAKAGMQGEIGTGRDIYVARKPLRQ
jgi:SAM-dependent methyltransferase